MRVLPDFKNPVRRQIDFAFGLIFCVRVQHAQIQSGLPSLGSDFEHIIVLGRNSSAADGFGAGDQPFHNLLQFRRGWRANNYRLAGLHFRDGQFQRVGGLDVRDLAKHLHQLRHIDKAREARVEPVACAVRRKFHCRHRLAERRRPGIEVMQLLFVDRSHLQIPLHREHFGHAVGNRRSRRKHHSSAAVDFLDVLNLQKHIEGAFR